MGLFDNNLVSKVDTIPRHIRGITCDVHNCIYHDGDNYCTASHITIGNFVATTASDTRCSTFKARGEITKGID